MKLLDKREVNLAKAKERHMEVQEGKKLADKVDQLRLLWASEERRMKEAKEAMITICRREIKDCMDELESVRRQIEHALGLKAEAEKPLDEKKNRLDRQEEEVAAYANKVHADGLAVELRAIEIGKREVSIIDTMEKANLFYEGAASINLESQKREKGSREQLRKAELAIQSARSYASRVEEAARLRDESSRKREDAVIEKEQGFADRERALSLRERAIIDREESHAREVARSRK